MYYLEFANYPQYLPENHSDLGALTTLLLYDLKKLQQQDLKLMNSEQLLQCDLKLTQILNLSSHIFEKLAQIATPIIYANISSCENPIKKEKSKKLKWIKRNTHTKTSPNT